MKRTPWTWIVFSVCVGAAQAQSQWPADVARFIERRDACDHFRGEDPYDQERREFLNQKMTELCAGTDAELSRLKSKYRNDKKVASKLNEYEAQIEPSHTQ